MNDCMKSFFLRLFKRVLKIRVRGGFRVRVGDGFRVGFRDRVRVRAKCWLGFMYNGLCITAYL